ncbi:hypothetical protein [Streptomyces sp. NRRL F-2890]|uniref:hypothetical protein n=1 Tax=Streptomyces sp. NRRL F-2890 TaxID=1463845 RepID=UPI0004C52857|nr:hypothetical protein [Streptomyces sp. NRRL F-2890]
MVKLTKLRLMMHHDSVLERSREGMTKPLVGCVFWRELKIELFEAGGNRVEQNLRRSLAMT